MTNKKPIRCDFCHQILKNTEIDPHSLEGDYWRYTVCKECYQKHQARKEEKRNYFRERDIMLDRILEPGSYEIIQDLGYMGFQLRVIKMTKFQWDYFKEVFNINTLHIESGHTDFFLNGPIFKVDIKKEIITE